MSDFFTALFFNKINLLFFNVLLDGTVFAYLMLIIKNIGIKNEKNYNIELGHFVGAGN